MVSIESAVVDSTTLLSEVLVLTPLSASVTFPPKISLCLPRCCSCWSGSLGGGRFLFIQDIEHEAHETGRDTKTHTERETQKRRRERSVGHCWTRRRNSRTPWGMSGRSLRVNSSILAVA